ncbi:MAG: hypothetical protein KKF20_07195 [Bacteroidetes bacterium]|nr:hypothetical protein [Bacteroidota bacterium]MBU1422294.1 hypothetical protein [Bacteroidota bacterium]MBU2472179.1 hypothetical protein [Bacteroidota bacterium]MBU2636345.1 hypothetical protein [Bacteroidota bacterium]
MKSRIKNFYTFEKSGFQKLAKILNAKPVKMDNNYRFEIINKQENRKLALEIYCDIMIGNKKGNLISIYTHNAHLQLHFCSGFVASDLLEEVTFIGETNGKLSGLIVERSAGCSLYANVDKKILSGDFTNLGPEVMLSGIALSLTESILLSNSSKKGNKKV